MHQFISFFFSNSNSIKLTSLHPVAGKAKRVLVLGLVEVGRVADLIMHKIIRLQGLCNFFSRLKTLAKLVSSSFANKIIPRGQSRLEALQNPKKSSI